LTCICWQYTQIIVRTPTICEQLREALKRSDLTVSQLLAKSGLEIARSTLQRKISGHEAMRTSEAEALATALGVTLVWMPEAEGAAS
jgi:transcriptional regulator with XRE-family HTH domain